MGVKERRERERAERRSQILDAARVLLFEKGLTGTSISQIAKKAEIGTGTIYFYFKSKEEIFASLQEEGLNILSKIILEAYQKSDNPKDKIKNIALGYFKFSLAHKDYFDVINYFLSSPDIIFAPDRKQEIDGHAGFNLDFLADTLKEGIDQGVFSDVSPKKFAIMFWATLHGMINLRKLQTTILAGEDYEELYHYSVNQLIESITT